MARKKTLSDELTVLIPAPVVADRKPRPPNQSASRLGSTRKTPAWRKLGVQQNYAGPPRTNAKGETFDTFTRPDRPGMTYHEYIDPEGNRRVVGMKKRTGPKKGTQKPIGG